VGEAQPAGGQASVTTDVTARRFRLASSATWAAVLGGLTATLLAVLVTLIFLSKDPRLTGDGADIVVVLSFAGVGFVVARRQPANPLGWVLLGTALSAALLTDAKLYAVLNYRIHGGDLPLGPLAVFGSDGLGPLSFLIGTTALILFPDGRMPSPRWRRVMWVYVVASGLWLAGLVTGAVSLIAGGSFQVDATGNITSNPAGLAGTLANFSWLFAALIPVIWLAWLGRQIATYRSASDLRREQLKWLTAGAVICVVSLVVTIMANGNPAHRALEDVSRLGIAAFPVCMGVAILRYRLYDIDRIISRTLAYAIVTGLLVGLYAGLVLLATGVLGFRTPVAVAAATLAAAALFNPLRRRVQKVVDRRFNRARFDADQTVAAFAARLKDAVDLDSVRDDLSAAVHLALEPAHVSVWISECD
jgi:hypothetical protein